MLKLLGRPDNRVVREAHLELGQTNFHVVSSIDCDTIKPHPAIMITARPSLGQIPKTASHSNAKIKLKPPRGIIITKSDPALQVGEKVQPGETYALLVEPGSDKVLALAVGKSKCWDLSLSLSYLCSRLTAIYITHSAIQEFAWLM